ncbi:MAG: transporter, partial [Deltaproteobacteria bacterium]|nr:transporter [Deltaproteobacteria bacterium]NIS76238.1 transporter [Deltaproteobacteria bacterium]
MVDYFSSVLHESPTMVYFIILGLGYLLGKVRIGTFDLGPVAGVLFLGLIFGHFGYGGEIPLQSVGFLLFIYSVGFQSGPKFFTVIRQDGLKYFTLALVIAGTGFGVAMGLSKVMAMKPGASAGILAGGLTSTPTLAAAQEAIRTGMIAPPAGFSADDVVTNITTGYAITYIFG